MIFVASSLACAVSTSIWQLDIARAAQGIGAAAMFSTSLALLANAYPDAGARAKALAVYGATIGGSFAVGPLAGGALTSWFGWRSVFFVNIPIGIICLLGARSVEESRDPQPRRPDWFGQVFAGAAMLLIVLALLRGNEVGWTATSTLLQFAGATACAVAFVITERVVAQSMVPLELFADRTFSGIQITAFAISASFFAMFVYMTFYLQGVLHLSAIQAGLVYVPGTMLSFFAAAATSTLLGRYDAKRLLLGGLSLIAIGLTLGLLVTQDTSWWMVLPSQIVALIGTGVFNPVMSGFVLNESPAGQEAMAVGINDAARQTGIAFGVALLGALIPASDLIGPGGASRYVDGLHHGLWLSIAIAVAGVIAGAYLIRSRRPVAAPADPAEPRRELVDA